MRPAPAVPTGALPVYGTTSALSKIFNPDIAVVGNFIGAAGKNDFDPRPAFNLDEAELSLQAIVDPYARADFFLAASPEGLEIEEGFVTFPTLPGGLLAKVGKLKAQFGKANTFHSHNLPWVDAPLPLTNLLGGDEGLNDSGVSVSKLILNPLLFLEATGEIYTGSNDLFTSHERDDLAYVGRLRGYRDITEGTNLDVGTSIAYGHNDAGPRLHDAGDRASMRRSGTARCGGATTAGSSGARNSSGAAATRGRAGRRVRRLCQRRVSIRKTMVRRRALRLLRPCRRCIAPRQERIAAGDVLAE